MFKWRSQKKTEQITDTLESKRLDSSVLTQGQSDQSTAPQAMTTQTIELKEEPQLFGADSTQNIELKEDMRDRIGSGVYEVKVDSSEIAHNTKELESITHSTKHSARSYTRSIESSDNNGEKNDRNISDKKRSLFSIFSKKQEATYSTAEHEKYILLFDLDGTLLDSIDGIYHSFSYACSVEFSPTLDEVRALIGLPLSEMFIRVGFSEKEAQNRAIIYKNNYRQIYLQKTKLLPNVIESLIIAKSFAHLGVVTTKTALYSKHILQHFDILKFFSVVIGSEDVTRPKPDPEPIYKALSSFPITPKEQVYMIGDTMYDLQAASNAGINGVWVRSGYGVGLDSSATMSFEGVFEAVKAIKTQAREYDTDWHLM